MPPLPFAWPADAAGRASTIASGVIGVSVSLVFVGVAANFLQALDAGPVARRQRSVVDTLTMTLFFVACYACIRLRLGVIAVPSVPASLAASALGAAIVVIGCAVNLAGRLGLGGNWANQVTLYAGQTLVTRGVFGCVRHPLYASTIWMFYGASLAYRSWLVALATTVVFVPMMRYRAKQEEALLEQRFPAYGAYRARVGRFLPRILRGHADDCR
jgi:protein-S-isoprenylcysteine O-methyltransferase Ste14